MRFSHIYLENWRNFGHVDVSLQNRAFLVGLNASGKSNFLDVFRFLRDIVTSGGGFQKSVVARGGVSRIRNLAARRNPDIVIRVTLQEEEEVAWCYHLAFLQDNQRRPLLKKEKVWRGNDLILNRPDDEDSNDGERLRQTYLEQTIANVKFRDIARFFASIRYYHVVPQLVRDPERSMGRQADPYGGDFLEQIAKTDKRTRESRLRHILAALKVAVPQLNELKLDKDERGIPHLYGNYEHWRARGAWQTEADFSDGTLRLMGLLWALLDGTGPLLLEEPELSLHPEIVRYIPQIMIRVQRRRKSAIRQVFLSTHSIALLDDEGIAADEVLMVVPSEKGSNVRSGADISEIKQLLETGLTAAEVVIPRTRPDNAAQLSLF
ncbi:chromosome segregation protein SMC [Candidatus Poribacteria bacterium]|nr:chromosome segregation protein SMC [Candidatus Poribacteria bacterium]